MEKSRSPRCLGDHMQMCPNVCWAVRATRATNNNDFTDNILKMVIAAAFKACRSEITNGSSKKPNEAGAKGKRSRELSPLSFESFRHSLVLRAWNVVCAFVCHTLGTVESSLNRGNPKMTQRLGVFSVCFFAFLCLSQSYAQKSCCSPSQVRFTQKFHSGTFNEGWSSRRWPSLHNYVAFHRWNIISMP